MLQHPELVSGKGRFDFALATSFPGRLLVKSGAEGMQVGAFVDPPLGFAIKVHDGGARALPPICISMLRQLGVLLGELPPALASHERPLLKNHNQIVTGEIRATLALVAHPPRA
jgi:L-asparaginase II